MKLRIFLAVFALLVLGAMGGGAWLFVHRHADPAIHAALLESQGDLRETLLLQRTAVTKDPTSPKARLDLAATMLKAFDGVAAEKGFRAAEPLGADHWTVLQGIGEALVLQGQWQKVLAELPEKGSSAAVTAKLLMLRGSAQIALAQLPAATATLDLAQAAGPGRPETEVLASRLALASNDRAGAIRSADAALAADPRNVDALMMKLALVSDNKDPALASAIIERTVAAAPWAVVPRLARVSHFMDGKEDEKARAELSILQARFPRLPAIRYLDAVLLARAGRLKEADAAFERLGPIAEQFPRALFVHSAVALALGNASNAMVQATRYHARFPADLDGVRLLARAQLANGKADLAVPLLEPVVAGPAAADVDMLNTLAAAYTQLGNTPGAVRVRQQAAAIKPDNAGLLANLGLSQLSQGSMAAAVESLDRSAGMATLPPAVDERLFQAALEIGDLQRAEAALQRRRTQDGETEAVGTMQAALLLARDDNEGAHKALTAVLSRFPDAIPAQVLQARLLVAEGQVGPAEALLAAILEKNPANMLALSTRVQLWVRANDLPAALRAVAVAQAAKPDDPMLVGVRAELMVRAKDPAKAIAVLEAGRVGGKLPSGLLAIYGEAQLAQGATDAALATFREALTAAPASTPLRLFTASLLLQTKHADEARVLLREGLARTPGMFNLMSALVSLETREAGPDAGLAVAQKLRDQPANLPAASFLKGDALLQAKQFDAAAAAYRLEYAAAPSQGLAIRLAVAEAAAGREDAGAPALRDWMQQHPGDADVAAMLAQLDTKAGRLEEAQAGLETRLQRRPNDPVALNNLAWLYQLKHDPRARDLAQRAYKLAPSPQTADTLGWILLQLGEKEEALGLLQGAIAKRPEDPALNYHLAVALQKTPRAKDGLKLLELLVARKDSFEDRAAAEQLLRQIKLAPPQ